MISAVTFLVAWVSRHLHRARRPQEARRDPRATFGRRDGQDAYRPYLAVLVWLAYRLGHGVHADPIAAHAWARQATALGWPEGVLEPVGGDDLSGRPSC